MQRTWGFEYAARNRAKSRQKAPVELMLVEMQNNESQGAGGQDNAG